MNALHRKKKAFLAVLLIMFILAPRLFEAQVSLADGKISPVALDPQSYATPIWQLPTPTPPPPTLSASEANKFVAVASEFTHPDSRSVSEIPLQLKRWIIRVNLMGIRSHCRERSLVSIVFSDCCERLLHCLYFSDRRYAWIPALYRGHVGALDIETFVQVSGAFIATSPAIHADVVIPLVSGPTGMIVSPKV